MSVRARCCALWLVLEWITLIFRCAGFLGAFGGSPARQRSSDLVWSDMDGFVRGTWRPLSSVEKLLSGKQDQGDCGDLVLPEETWLPGSDTLRECFNNMDVGAPLWQSELRDKSSCREFASSHPSFKLLHFILYFLCLYFYRVVSW